LEEQFELIKENYRIVNELFGDLVKVTPSSKVVGDMALFMTSNGYTKEDILERGDTISFPDSVKAFFRGDLGQPYQGFPKKLQKMVLKDEQAYTERPNAHLAPVDFEQERQAFLKEFPFGTERDFLSYKLYPKVFRDFYEHFQTYGVVRTLPSHAFFYGLRPNEEILVKIADGKDLLIQFLNVTEPNEQGFRTASFKLNGQNRSILVQDLKLQVEKVVHKKVEKDGDIGAPLQGSLSKILVKQGDEVKVNAPLFIIEAMKMESTITAPVKGRVKKIHLTEKTMVEQDDLVVELE
jgi:pyruvate carboxylase